MLNLQLSMKLRALTDLKLLNNLKALSTMLVIETRISFIIWESLKSTKQTNFASNGNGIISVFKGHQFKSRSYDKQLVDKLDEKYETNTSSFAEDLEDLFKNNTNIAGYPFVTSEVYILLLFEIARQRVKGSDEMKKYNKLKIDEAITNLIALMKADYCRFDDVFLEGGKFHCFNGEPKDREIVIEKIEKSLKQAQRKMRT